MIKIKVNYYGIDYKEYLFPSWEFYNLYDHRFNEIDYWQSTIELPERRLIRKMIRYKERYIFSTESNLLLEDNSNIRIRGKESIIKKSIYNPETNTMNYYTDYPVRTIKANDEEVKNKLNEIKEFAHQRIKRIGKEESMKKTKKWFNFWLR